MRCERTRQVLSAALDGEASAVELDAARTHVVECPGCTDFDAAISRLHRASRVIAAPEVPDLAPSILAAIDREPTARTAPTRVVGAAAGRVAADQERVLRWALVAVAAVQIALAVPALVLGDDAGLPVHIARHLGSFELALAAGFLLAAWRPERIAGFLPVVTVLVGALFVSGLIDVVNGDIAALGETHHLTDLVGLAILWMLSRPVAVRARFA